MYFYFGLLILSACQIKTGYQSSNVESDDGYKREITFGERGETLHTLHTLNGENLDDNGGYKGEVFIGRNWIYAYSFVDENAKVDCYPTDYYKLECYMDILHIYFEKVRVGLFKRTLTKIKTTSIYKTSELYTPHEKREVWMCINQDQTVKFRRVHNVLNVFFKTSKISKIRAYDGLKIKIGLTEYRSYQIMHIDEIKYLEMEHGYLIKYAGRVKLHPETKYEELLNVQRVDMLP